MSLKQYLAEVKERAEKYADYDSSIDIPRLIAIVEAQAEALEKIRNEHPGGAVEWAILIADNALAKAEAIAGGEDGA